MKQLLSGNEAIARGAYEHGVRVATAYPGTPSTEILENIATYDDINSEWAPNEKVAVEVAQGASYAGARSICAMKHVGVNVAADPLFTFVFTGVNGGFILVSADDPGMHSSQNEQDNRYYAKFMKMALLEPSDSQEAKDYVGLGLDLSEQFDTPVMLRTTTRIAHAKGVVELNERKEVSVKRYQKNIPKHVIVPAFARRLRAKLEDRLTALEEYSNMCPANRIEGNGQEFAVITSGIAYQYAKEALGERATYLKLGMTFPLPRKLIADFITRFDKVYVIEEGEPYLEEQIKALGFTIIGKELFPKIGELSTGLIQQKLLGQAQNTNDLAGDIPIRPPVMCPGCPHRGVYYSLNKLGYIVTGDIGCYSLAVLPPLETMETCICMGASIGNAHGMSKVITDRKIVATIGDSTFFHTGINGLLDLVYNKGVATVVILDNSTTGMTGHQHHPGTGYTLKNEPTRQIDIEALCRACGVEHVQVVNAYALTEVEAAVRTAAAVEEPSVVIVRQPCVLIDKTRSERPYCISMDCKKCLACLKLGCPAISYTEGQIAINSIMCTSCGVCAQLCKFGAIVGEKDGEVL